jgi:hypothetical protein
LESTLNQSRAFFLSAYSNKLSLPQQHYLIAEQKIRTQRIIGQLLKADESIKRSGTGSNQHKRVQKSSSSTSAKTLSDYGLSKYESSTFLTILLTSYIHIILNMKVVNIILII